MGDPVAGVGAQFRRWNAGSWEDITQITNIAGPGMTREMIDVTTLGSTDGWREKITGFRDAGSMVLSMLFTRDAYETMKTDFESDTKQNYELVLPDDDTTTFEFEGLVTELPLTIAPDAAITFEVTIEISGPPTLESGSGPSPG